MGDFDGDGKDDILCRKSGGAGREVALSGGTEFKVRPVSFVSVKSEKMWCKQHHPLLLEKQNIKSMQVNLR